MLKISSESESSYEKKLLLKGLNMELLNATSDLVGAIKKLALWNENSTELQDYEILNNAIRTENNYTTDKVLSEMLSDETSKYDILNKALGCGFRDIAHYMLEKSCQVNETSFVPTCTPLHNAVKLGDAKIVTKLLEKGASITVVNWNRDSALHIAYNDAFISEDYQLVDLLLAHIEKTSFYINIKNQHGLSHLHIAASRGKTKLVKSFIEAGASLFDFVYDDSPTHAGYTALEFACDLKNLDTIKICRQVFPDRLQISEFVSNNIQKKNSLVVSQMLMYMDSPYQFIINLRHRFGEDCDRLSKFHLACLKDNLSTMKRFLDKGEDVDAAMSRNAEFTPLYTALHFALESENERFEKVKLLLDHDADVYVRNGFCMTALHLAMYTHNRDQKQSPKAKQSTLELLYSFVQGKEANPMDCNGLTYLHIAVVVNDIELVTSLLDSGEDVNQTLLSDLREYSNYTPLHFAVRYDRDSIARLLIERGAKVNPKKGETPLQIALEFGYTRLIDLLLEHDALIKIVKHDKKMTTLHLLVEYYIEKSCSCNETLAEKEKLIGLAKKLIELGVDVNAKDVDGFTALHSACWDMYNGIWLIELLLSAGANINLKNNQGETPLDVARRRAAHGTYDDFLLLYHHVQRLKALGLEVDGKADEFCESVLKKKEEWKKNEDWKIVEEMYSDETLARMKKERLHEIMKLEKDMIADGVSLYDYLKMDVERAADYVNNEYIKKIVEDEVEAFYEVYGYLIAVQYRKSLDWIAARVSKEHESEEE